MARIYINPINDRIIREDIYLVTVILSDGTRYEHLEPRRLFPVTSPSEYITLLDRKENEIALIKSLDDLDETSRKAVADCFTDYYMIPKITEVIECSEKFGALKWIVNTDRGKIEFRITNRHSDIKMLPDKKRVIIRDSNDNRYEIEDIDALDKKSLKQLFGYI